MEPCAWTPACQWLASWVCHAVSLQVCSGPHTCRASWDAQAPAPTNPSGPLLLTPAHSRPFCPPRAHKNHSCHVYWLRRTPAFLATWGLFLRHQSEKNISVLWMVQFCFIYVCFWKHVTFKENTRTERRVSSVYMSRTSETKSSTQILVSVGWLHILKCVGFLNTENS